MSSRLHPDTPANSGSYWRRKRWAASSHGDPSEEMALAYVDNPDLQAAILKVYGPLVQNKAKVLHQEHCDIIELLDPDKESTHLEYKATLRTHGDAGEETATLKTIAAFLNSREGETHLIGVADDSTVRGLDSDYASRSKTDQNPGTGSSSTLDNMITTSMGEPAATNVRPQHPRGQRRRRLRGPGRPRRLPRRRHRHHLGARRPKETRTEFYARVANGTKALDSVEPERYTSPSAGAP